MKQYLNIICSSPLFHGIAEDDTLTMLQCLGASVRQASKGELIFCAGDPADRIGVVLSGGLQVCRDDALGYRTILAALGPGDIFGEGYACAQIDVLPVSVQATEDSSAVLLDCRRILTVCPSSCPFHASLIRNLTSVLANKNVFLTQRMAHLSKRTLRDKLLSYLEEQAFRAGAQSFRIPLDRQGLADYLCADRSALSRELGRLKQDGEIDFVRNQFHLLGRGRPSPG